MALKKKKKEIRSFSLIIFGLISVLWVFKHVWRTEKLLSRKFDLGEFNTENKTDGVPPDKATRDWIIFKTESYYRRKPYTISSFVSYLE